MQINKFLRTIHKVVKVVYKKQLMRIQFSLVRTYELTYKFIYLHKLFFLSSKISQSKQGPHTNFIFLIFLICSFCGYEFHVHLKVTKISIRVY